MTNQELTMLICKTLDDKKAEDITVLDVAELTVVADNYVICTGRNSTHVKTLAEYVVEELEKQEIKPLRSDGMKDGRWTVVDYGSTILHIFNDETRVLFCLEKLWGKDDNVKKFPQEFAEVK